MQDADGSGRQNLQCPTVPRILSRHVLDTMDRNGYGHAHVCRIRPQPKLPARRAAPRDMVGQGPQEGPQAHPRQPLQAAARTRRGDPRLPQGCRRTAARGRVRGRVLAAPRRRRGRARHAPKARPRPDRLPAPLPAARPRGRHDRGPHHRAQGEARDGPERVPRKRVRHARPDARHRRHRRERALRRHGLASGAAGAHRDGACAAASRRALPGAVGPDLRLDGGPELRAREVRPLPRRQEGQAAGRVRPHVRPRGTAGRRGGLRGQHVRSGHRRDGGRTAADPLRPRTGRPGRRPRHARRRAAARGRPARRPGLDQCAQGARDPRAGGERNPAAVAVRRHGHGGDRLRGALSGRAPDGVPQPVPGGGARPQARGPPAGDRDGPPRGRGGDPAQEPPPHGRDEHRPAAGEGPDGAEDEEALRRRRPGRRLLMAAQRREHRRRGGPGRLLRGSHQPSRKRHGSRRDGQVVQVPRPRGQLIEDLPP